MLGLGVGAGLTFGIRQVFSILFRREAMGLGDVTLMGMIGAYLGWQAAVLTFFLGAFVGLGHALWKLVRNWKKRLERQPIIEQRSRIALWTILEFGGGLALFCMALGLANLLAKSLHAALRDILVDVRYLCRPAELKHLWSREAVLPRPRRAIEFRAHGGAAEPKALLRRSLPMAYEYKRRRPSIIRNFWVYRRLIGTAVVLGVMLWFIMVNHEQVTVHFPFGFGTLTSTSGIVMLLSALVGSVATILVTTVILAIRRMRRGQSPAGSSQDDRGRHRTAAGGLCGENQGRVFQCSLVKLTKRDQ